MQSSELSLAEGNKVAGGINVAKYLALQPFAKQWLGNTKSENADVEKWSNATVDESGLKALNEHLRTRTYIAGNGITLPDVLLYAQIQPIVKDLTIKKRHNLLDLVRWFDFIQNHDDIKAQAGQIGLSYVDVDPDIVPKIIRKAPEKKKDKKADAVATATTNGADGVAKNATPAVAAATPAEAKKKEKAPKEKKEKKPAAAPAPDLPPVPYMIDLRVGHIIKAEKHPDADTLYVETMDLGEAEPRTVVSGLVKHIPLEEMQNRNVIAVCNLKPVAMRGVKSFAMVLCATSVDGKVEIVDPPKDAKPGQRVWFDDYHGEPEALLNPKKKIWETVQPGFFTTESREAAFKDAEGKTHLLKTSDGGLCTVPTVVGGSIR